MSSNTNTVVATSAAAVVAGTSYLLYRSIPAILTALTKLLKNPLDEELDRVIQETGAPSYKEIAALGIVAGKSALVVGGTRGVGYGTALALAMSGASLVTVVGRSAASGSRAVSRITNELADEKSSSSSTIINFVQGDIGTVASTNALLEKLQRRDAPRYDYLIDGGHLPATQEPKSLAPERRWGRKILWRRGGWSVPLVPQGPHVHENEPPKNDLVAFAHDSQRDGRGGTHAGL